MIYITGDTHGRFERFTLENFPEQVEMTKDDFAIICGDFGGVWDGHKAERRRLDRLESLPFTLLFVSGNHENFDLLKKFPVEDWHGGKIQRIRPHVIHLLRGQVFELEKRTFFTMGGARSHDIENGILDPRDPDFAENRLLLRGMAGGFRVKHRTWWEEELPSPEEYETAKRSLEQAGHQVDYIITHCAPNAIVDKLGSGEKYKHDPLTDFLEEVRGTTAFLHWFFGHYHDNRKMDGHFVLLWDQIIRLL